MTWIRPVSFSCVLTASLALAGCGGNSSDPKAEAPPQAKVQSVEDRNVFEADHSERFPLATAESHLSSQQLRVTGSIVPDVSRSVPVVSLATGRVVAIEARLGDSVKKGQLLLRVQSADLSTAFSDYRKAVVDEQLARAQLERAKDLYDKGAGPLKDLQAADDAEAKAKVDVENTTERIRVLGGSLDHPSSIVEIRAPVSGVITDQQVTNASGIAGLGAPNPFTISDLSSLWILCDVFENDLGHVHLGEKAEIRLNAYPDKILTGVIGNIGAVLDPNLRTAKVRIEIRNNGLMRPGMFVTATFRGKKEVPHTTVPATAILHLHDRDWVYVPLDGKRFRRAEVTGGDMLPNGIQEVTSGLKPGDKVVANALEFQNSVEQQ
jgi:cobalt-zinc-cadmium efflux system membrane fusion protein